MVVTDKYDTTTTFEEIFEGQKAGQPKRKHVGEATPVLDTIEQYVDQYLNSAGFEMTSREFYKWKKSIDNQNIKEDKGRKKGSQTPQARES